MTEHKEPKLCPFMGVPHHPMSVYDVEIPRPQIIGVFGHCLEDKCAMWREYSLAAEGIEGTVGYCGLAGK